MARINLEVPQEILNIFNDLETNSEQMMSEMTLKGANVVLEAVKTNFKKSFKSDKSILQGLKLSRTYKTPSDDGINTKVIIDGYNDEGVAIPLIAMAREFGTSRGESKRPFFRRAFNGKAIESVMLKVQEKYLPKE